MQKRKNKNMIWDIFISHASEDKDSVARPLSELLENAGLKVWLDEAQISLGDSLRKKLDEGLIYSKYGLVILSPSFIKKDWTQRELGAFQSREFGNNKVILPVWHEITQKEVLNFSPLLGDRIAVSTSLGLEKVRDEIIKALQFTKDKSNPPILENRYKSDFKFNTIIIEDAFEAIKTLISSMTWKHLEPKVDMSIKGEWMGTNSDMLIKIFYDLYLPILTIQNMRYNLRRSLATFTPLSRIKFSILDRLFLNLTNEEQIAFVDPFIDYTPRVKNWRCKRKEYPQRYWWQGISNDRLEESERFFIATSTKELEMPILKTFSEFKKSYNILYRGIPKDKQALGLLANAIYGFKPKERPVYFRLLTSWMILYQLYKRIDSENFSKLDFEQINSIINDFEFPSEINLDESLLYEPIEVTLKSMKSHIQSKLKTEIELYLKIPKENNSAPNKG